MDPHLDRDDPPDQHERGLVLVPGVQRPDHLGAPIRAFGLCTSDSVYVYYATTTAFSDPSWGELDGYDSFSSSTTSPGAFTLAAGVYLKTTFSAEDADHDGSDAIDDCDDGDANVSPDEPEVWYNGVDNDCSGGDDYDQDGDGHDVESHGGDDCEDTDPSVHPGAEDRLYDGEDSDCDGASDYDADGDGYDSADYGGDDCDDRDAHVHPGAEDAWYDGEDTNCDGASDYDQDGDGHDAQSAGGDDCDDTDAGTFSDCGDNGGNGGANGGNGGDDSGADDTGGGGQDTGTAEGGGCRKDKEEGKKGCCGGGAALMIGGLTWSLTRRRALPRA